MILQNVLRWVKLQFGLKKQMSELSRFGVSVEDELLKSFDQLISEQGYANRSEALRDLMRDALVKSSIENPANDVDEVVGGCLK